MTGFFSFGPLSHNILIGISLGEVWAGAGDHRKDGLLKNEITNLTRTGKKAYYQKYFSENKGNLQKIWKGIKEIINIKSKNFDYPTCLQVGDVNITEPMKYYKNVNII